MQCPWMLLFIVELESLQEAHGWAQVWSVSISVVQSKAKQSISYVIRGASHPFECPQCGLRFDRKSQLGYHVEKNHQQVLFLFLLSTLHWPIVLKVVRHSCPICNKGFYRSSDCKVMRFYPSVSFTGVSFCRFTSARIQKLRNFLVKLVEKVFPMSATWTDTREFTPKRSLMYVLTVEKGSTKPPPCKITKKSILPTCSVNVLNAPKSSRLAEFY